MQYSDRLNGFWEEGYHYYLEFRDDQMTVRRYDRVVELETKVSYDAAALDRGKETLITPENRRLASGLTGNMMREIDSLRWKDGILELVTNNYADEHKTYSLKKTENGPFSHIVIRDDEYLEKLQGVWKEWGERSTGLDLLITGNHLKWGILGEGDFHVISYNYRGNYDSAHVYLVPADLTRENFDGFTKIEVEPDMLITHMIVYDMSVPATVFAREDMLDKISVPGSATRPAVNTMTNTGGRLLPGSFMGMGMTPWPDIRTQPAPQPDIRPDVKADNGPSAPEGGSCICPGCGAKWNAPGPKFCPECGSRLHE